MLGLYAVFIQSAQRFLTVLCGLMGSVGPNYKCPWCGRVDNGGYAMDGIDIAICTEGDYSCLGYQVFNQDLDRCQFQKRALEVVITIRRPHQQAGVTRSPARWSQELVDWISHFLHEAMEW